MSPKTEHSSGFKAEEATLYQALVKTREKGQKILIPYLTGGLSTTEKTVSSAGGKTQSVSRDWLAPLYAATEAGANAIEIGIPFSDPVMDGPVIQQANDLALADNTTPVSIANDQALYESPIPLAVMTYYNIAFRMGLQRFAALLNKAAISATILPDLPLHESSDWVEAANAQAVEHIQFAAPTSTDERLEQIAASAQGFIYCVGLLGVTGERDELAKSALRIAKRMKSVTDKPVLVGVGIGSGEQAVEVCEYADGVIIGSTLVRRLIDPNEPQPAQKVGEIVHGFRQALDAG